MEENVKRQIINDRIIEFYPEPHTYYIDGEQVISATQVASFLNPFRKMKIPDRVLKIAGAKGTKIHNAIEEYLTNGTPFPEDDKHYLYFKAFLDFMEKEGKEVTFNALEKVAFGEIDGVSVIGTLDVIGEYKGKPIVIDWKTSSAMTLPEWRLQLGLYKFFVSYTYGLEDADTYICWLKKNGKYEFINVKTIEFKWITVIYSMLKTESKKIIDRFNLVLLEVFGDELK